MQKYPPCPARCRPATWSRQVNCQKIPTCCLHAGKTPSNRELLNLVLNSGTAQM